MIGYLIWVAFVGLFVGAFARLALPGKDPMTIGQTLLTGMGGALAAGFLGVLLFGQRGGFLLSVICAAGIVYAVRRSRGGSLTRPGRPPR